MMTLVTRSAALRAAWGRRTVHVSGGKGFGATPPDDPRTADALVRSLDEVSKKRGRVARTKNLVMGGDTTEANWRELDKELNSYPSQRMFTAIGSGGSDFVDFVVSGVEHHLGPVHVECINQRESSNGNYLSVTVGPVWVQNADQSRVSSRLRSRSGKAARVTPLSRERISHTSMRAAVVAQDPLGHESKLLQGTLDIQPLPGSLKENSHTYENNATRLLRPRQPFIDHPCKNAENVGCPVYVMLPLDTVTVIQRQGKAESQVLKETELRNALDRFKSAGVHGVMVDIWWGIVERNGSQIYDYSAYKKLFEMIQEAGLKIQAVMSFHAAGSNVGDTCEIPLPKWVLEIGCKNPEIFYTDRKGYHNEEYLSLGCDEESIFQGRTPVDMYRDFVDAFANEFQYLFGDVITEITVGLGPAGELRYPAYPEGDGRWAFPGVGEFQCYDAYMLASLRKAATEAGRKEWGFGGPHDAGCYNSKSSETGFFNCHSGTFDSCYGHFFLEWYSGMLIRHADRILTAISQVLNKSGRPKALTSRHPNPDGSVSHRFASSVSLGVKLAGVHWWFKTRSHAAELTAGYYNTHTRDGYAPIMEIIRRHNALLSFTCVEMRDCEHPPESMCSPQGLLRQVINGARKANIPISGENALQRYDEYAFSRITESAFGEKTVSGSLQQVTFLRMGGLMFDNWQAFSGFINRMRTPVLH